MEEFAGVAEFADLLSDPGMNCVLVASHWIRHIKHMKCQIIVTCKGNVTYTDRD